MTFQLNGGKADGDWFMVRLMEMQQMNDQLL
jgi:hypothetical protein